MKRKSTYFRCICECGNEKIIRKDHLIKNKTKSCGCYNIERIIQRSKKYNTYDLTGEYGIGYTIKGERFYFDICDYERIMEYCWHISHNGYLMSRINRKLMQLHKIIMNTVGEEDKIIDHINRN